MANYIQTEYSYYQQKGYVGQLARPYEPHRFELGKLYVATSGTKPRPGDPVHWNATQNAFQLASSAFDRAQPIGLVSYDTAHVQGSLATKPAGANSSQFIEYEDGDVVKIMLEGTMWVLAGAAAEFGNRVVYQTTDKKWNADTDDLVPSTDTTIADIRDSLNGILPVLRAALSPFASASPPLTTT